ncbi:MAG TPA: hypothetical protein VFI10_03600 [Gaiellaceae bacterium]|nr:hypothetical protein [Gaiellaceae bacterium]
MTPRATTAAILALLAALLLWNAFHYPWGRSYDAISFRDYIHTLYDLHRLPRTTDTAVWHNPPLFFAVAGAIVRGARHLGVGNAERLVQLLDAACVFGIALLTFGLARELFPRRRWLPVLALAATALTPVLVRAGALFHPDPLATLLNTAGIYVLVRALVRGDGRLRTGAIAGVLLALGALTRTWGLTGIGAALAATLVAWRWRNDPRALRLAGGVALAALVLVAPWLVVKQVRYGSAVAYAYSQPHAQELRDRYRKPSVFLGLAPRDVFAHPWNPHFRNRPVPVLYADWWGDYWLAWRVRKKYAGGPLPASYTRPLARQAVVGIPLTIAAIVGVVALAVRAIRRRDGAVLLVVLALLFVVGAFLAFAYRYPRVDGDNIKALYVLDAVPMLAIGCAVSLAWLWRRWIAGRAAVLAALAVTALPSVWFLILRSRH